MNRRLFKWVAGGLFVCALAIAGVRVYQRASDAVGEVFESDSISKTDRPEGSGAVVFLRRFVMADYSLVIFAEDPGAQIPVVSMGTVELEHNLRLESALWSGDGSLFIAVIAMDFGKKAKGLLVARIGWCLNYSKLISRRIGPICLPVTKEIVRFISFVE